MDFIDAMVALKNGKRITNKNFLNCHWEYLGGGLYEERSTGIAACAGSIKFNYNDIGEEWRNSEEWEIVND